MHASRPTRILLPSALLMGLAFWPCLALAQAAEVPATPAGAPPAAQASTERQAVEALRKQIDEVDERSRVVERKLELQAEEAAKAKNASVTAGEKGFALKSADGAFAVSIRGLVQADARAFFGDDTTGDRSTFLVRRARPILEASFLNVADFRVTPDFGGGQASVQDAYGDLRPFPWLKLRAGKFTPPVGLERLQSSSANLFVEYATPTALVPNRDVGAQLHGDIAGGLVSYALGLFNGVLDGASGDADTGFAKDVIGRVFVQPFKSDPHSLLAGLGVGVGASTGNRRGRAAVLSTSGTSTTVTTASTPTLASFRSAGQQSVFSYITNDKVVDGTVLAEGRHTRLAPQGYYYVGPFGLLGEYVRSTHSVRKGTESAKLNHSAWQVAASYLIGGGTNTFGGVQVKNAFDPSTGKLGVLEIAARYNELRIDGATFPLYADPAKSIKLARGFALALNWHWSRNVKLAAVYEETRFEGGKNKGNRDSERVLFSRLQLAF